MAFHNWIDNNGEDAAQVEWKRSAATAMKSRRGKGKSEQQGEVGQRNTRAVVVAPYRVSQKSNRES